MFFSGKKNEVGVIKMQLKSERWHSVIVVSMITTRVLLECLWGTL